MLRLGSLLLAGVLLGVPRALDARAFAAQRSVYLDISPLAPELVAFARDLERALVAASYDLAANPFRATVVVALRSAATAFVAPGRAIETVVITVQHDGRARPLVLQHAPERRAAAARALLDRLGSARLRAS